MRNLKLLDVNLRLFDGEGGAPASGGTQASSAAAGQGDTGGAVVYGKQPANAKAADAGQTTTDMERAYRKLVDGEYKDQYARDMDNIIRRRLKGAKDQTDALKARVDSYQPLIDKLSERYGVADGDVGKLAAALDGDTAYLEQAADKAGLSVEQYKEQQQLRAERDRLVRQEAARRGQEAAERQYNKWLQEAEAARQTYPGLDLRAECQDPQFLSMLRSNVPVKVAYEALHHDALIQAAMSTAARKSEQKVVDSVRAKGSRPKENGTASQSGFVVRDDVSRLTRKDMEEINRRVMNGEKISFG